MPPVVAAVAATVGGVIAAGGVAAATATSFLGFTSTFGILAAKFAVNLAVGALMSFATKALTPKPKIPNLSANFSDLGSSASGRLVNVKQAIMTRQVAYGTVRMAGSLIFAESTNDDEFLHLIFAVAGHEINSFESFLINEDSVEIDGSGFVTTSKYVEGDTKFIRLKTHLGADDQLADTDLIDESDGLWTSNHRLRGIAYIYARLKFSNDIFPNGIPNISAIIQGKKLYDPRTTSTTFSSNSALAVRDFLTNTRYGLGAKTTEINDTSFTAGANVCDETVTLDVARTKSFNTETSVSSTNETITINSHGYFTGDAVQYSNEGGTNLTGLTSTTTYFVIKSNANTFKLASSLSNANAGTAIDITAASEGNGQTQLFKRLIEKRYETNGVLDVGETPAKILNDMTSSCIGLVTYSGGKWNIKTGEFVSPTLTLTDDDLRGAISITTRNTRRDSFNAVKGIFVNPDNFYQPTDFPSITSSTFETEDNSEQIFSDIELPFTTSPSMAQRIAKIILYRAREQITLNYPCKTTAFNLEVGDTVNITNVRLGFSAKPFEVAGWAFAQSQMGGGMGLGIDLNLREISSSVYDWSAEETAIISNNTNLPNPFDIAVPSIAITDELRNFNQEAITALIVDVSTEDNFVDNFEVLAKKSSDSNFTNMGRASGGRFELINVEDNITYDVKARAITTLGSKSSFATGTHQVVGKSAPPADVTDFSVNIDGAVAHLTWTPVADLDLSHYKIRHSGATSGATYQNATDLVPKVARPAQSVTVPALTGTYFCKAVDKLGLSSNTAATSVAIIDSIQLLTDIGTITESTGFAGTKDDVVVTTGGTLILDTLGLFDSTAGNFDDAVGLFDGGGGTVDNLGTYDFATKTDLSSKFTAKVTPFITVSRSDYVNTFDDASGNFDAREGNFDGDVTAFDDTNVEFQIATTDDDPASGSASFTAFRRFIAGDYTARGFKYRVILTSSDTQATPVVSVLGVKVAMQDSTRAFKELQGLNISGQNLASGDFYAITSKSATGFTIEFFNSSGGTVNRTFDYVAKGFGELAS